MVENKLKIKIDNDLDEAFIRVVVPFRNYIVPVLRDRDPGITKLLIELAILRAKHAFIKDMMSLEIEE